MAKGKGSGRPATCFAICFIVVLAVAVILVGGIRRPDWIEYAYDKIVECLDEIAIFIVAVAAFFLLFRIGRAWYMSWKYRKKCQGNSCCETDCKPLVSPYPGFDWKDVVGVEYKSDLCLARRKQRLPHTQLQQ